MGKDRRRVTTTMNTDFKIIPAQLLALTGAGSTVTWTVIQPNKQKRMEEVPTFTLIRNVNAIRTRTFGTKPLSTVA